MKSNKRNSELNSPISVKQSESLLIFSPIRGKRSALFLLNNIIFFLNLVFQCLIFWVFITSSRYRIFLHKITEAET